MGQLDPPASRGVRVAAIANATGVDLRGILALHVALVGLAGTAPHPSLPFRSGGVPLPPIEVPT